MVKPENQLATEKSRKFLARTILTYAEISEDTLKKITDIFEPVYYEKNYPVLKEGDIAQYLHFICVGIIKVSYYKEEKEIIDWFAEEGIFIGNFLSYQTKQPVLETYESIEKVDMLRARYADIENLLKDTPEVEIALRKIQAIYHAKYVLRSQNLKSLSAEQKHHLFMTEYGDYVNRIPLKFIANYLGMTPETLSRIRAKYDKSNNTKK